MVKLGRLGPLDNLTDRLHIGGGILPQFSTARIIGFRVPRAVLARQENHYGNWQW